jgi:site-specific DNA-methyltransferase (cytosine-N4-specific)
MDRQTVTPYYQDSTVTLYQGKNLDVLPTLAAGSVDCCVTSPPYYGLRDYGHPDQIGAEASPAEFVEALRSVFSEVRRVLADDATLWLNLGDSYNAYNGNRGTSATGFSKNGPLPALPKGSGLGVKDLPAKNLLGIPWRVAFALQDDGWILRNAIIWNKPNAMPESVTDRLSTRYEMLFMFSKNRKYWFDLDPIREAIADGEFLSTGARNPRFGKDNGGLAPSEAKGTTPIQTTDKRMRGRALERRHHNLGRNPGDVWSIPTQPFPGGHFAVFPPELPRRCLVAGCKPGGTVLDPFHGSGTTGMVATRNGRKYIGIELNREYIDLSLRTRLADGTLDFGEDTA